MNESLFVTGTDTGIGKTIVTAMLVRSLRKSGQDTLPYKPVQTGAALKDGSWIAPDIHTVLTLNNIHDADESSLSPICYPDPCSPHLAAARAGAPIDLDSLVSITQEALTRHGSLIVEGAGGLIVPLNDDSDMLDLIIALSLPVVLVARAALGTLNHTLLSVKALKESGCVIAGIVLMNGDDADLDYITDDNRATLQHRTGLPVIGPIPYTPGLDTPETFARLHDQWHTELLQLL